MTKQKIVYSLLVIIFIFVVFSITFTYLSLYKENQGVIDTSNKYYDITFSNVVFDYETSSSVKINNDDNILHIEIPNLEEYRKGSSFKVDVTNIGNIDAYIENMYLSNISSNIDTSNIDVDVNLNKNDVIKGSESKKLIITISYNGNEKNIVPTLNFNINYEFREVVL